MTREPGTISERCVGAAAEDLGTPLTPAGPDMLLDRAARLATQLGAAMSLPDVNEWPMPSRSW